MSKNLTTTFWALLTLLQRFWPIFGPPWMTQIPNGAVGKLTKKGSKNGSKIDPKSGFPKMHFLRFFWPSLIRLFSVQLFSSFFIFLSPSPKPDRGFLKKSWPQKWHFFWCSSRDCRSPWGICQKTEILGDPKWVHFWTHLVKKCHFRPKWLKNDKKVVDLGQNGLKMVKMGHFWTPFFGHFLAKLWF